MNGEGSKHKGAKAKAGRPQLLPISEQMKAWSSALGAEITGWPQVSTRPMFGFNALYRREKIFAILPRTRGMGTPHSLAFKLESPSPQLRARLGRDARIGITEMRAMRWQTFELSSANDLHDALDWLQLAYEAAGKKGRVSPH